mgnify:CR=1 FL=1|jgi:ubiquinone/menaquinone biosynthesis C-methylase UbiE|tara:strand:+ start:1928 stop:2677 length:750 start_codon:yes stop_codon:yes gene_type:complete
MVNLKKQWDIMSQTYAWSEFEWDIVLPTFLKIIGDIKNKKILDLGCGPGNIANFLAKKGAKVTGIDQSKGMLNIAKEQEKRLKQSIRYVHSDFTKLDRVLKNNSYDGAVFSFVLHNIHPVKSIYSILEKINKKLKKGASLYILDPHPCFEFIHNNKDTTRETSKKNIIYKENFPIKITLYPKRGKPTIIKHKHKSLQEYINAIASSKFKIEQIEEVTTPKRLKNKFKLQYKIPFYIIIKATKISGDEKN